MFIDVLQLIIAGGPCEINNVIHNCVEAAIEVEIAMVIKRLISG